MNRRRALALFGGVALATATSSEWLDALVAAATQRGSSGPAPTFPRGAIIRAVSGDIAPDAIVGATLMHEHLGTGTVPRPRGGEPPPAADNPTQDAAWMAEELTAAKRAGLGAIVSAQTNLPGPDILKYLTQLSERSGLQIVATGAYYNKATYPSEIADRSEDDIATTLVAAARDGRFGAFGELGVANEEADMDPLEKKVFRAFGRAQVRTGLPIFTHNNYSTGPAVPMDMGLRQLDALEAGGAKPASVAIGHVCCLDDPMAAIARRIAQRGAFVAFDRVTRQQQWVSDEKRVVMVKALLDAGLVDHLLFSSDYIGRVNTAVGEINRYPGPLHAREGGPGYARPLLLFVPLLKKAGVDDATIRRITVDNPRRFLAYVPKA
jgi:phosphotriesterase-related protein